jgi:predicted DNA-binding antitoxin AbrB/MazE fold protein
MIEVIYQDNVFKPLSPVKGLRTNEKTWIIFCSSLKKTGLEELIGTLTQEESEKMQKDIDKEFSHIEGEW